MRTKIVVALMVAAVAGACGQGGGTNTGEATAPSSVSSAPPSTPAAGTVTAPPATYQRSAEGFRSFLEDADPDLADDVDWDYTAVSTGVTAAPLGAEEYLEISFRRELDRQELAAACEAAAPFVDSSDPPLGIQAVGLGILAVRPVGGACEIVEASS